MQFYFKNIILKKKKDISIFILNQDRCTRIDLLSTDELFELPFLAVSSSLSPFGIHHGHCGLPVGTESAG